MENKSILITYDTFAIRYSVDSYHIRINTEKCESPTLLDDLIVEKSSGYDTIYHNIRLYHNQFKTTSRPGIIARKILLDYIISQLVDNTDIIWLDQAILKADQLFILNGQCIKLYIGVDLNLQSKRIHQTIKLSVVDHVKKNRSTLFFSLSDRKLIVNDKSIELLDFTKRGFYGLICELVPSRYAKLLRRYRICGKEIVFKIIHSLIYNLPNICTFILSQDGLKFE